MLLKDLTGVTINTSNKAKKIELSMKINDKLFAVSSHNFVIPLVVQDIINIMPEDDYHQIKTSVDLPESEQYETMKTHHRIHFLNMFICDGELDNSSVFESKGKALDYACSRNESEIESLEAKMKELMARRGSLGEECARLNV
jgi:hypothetical protein